MFHRLHTTHTRAEEEAKIMEEVEKKKKIEDAFVLTQFRTAALGAVAMADAAASVLAWRAQEL